MQSANQVLPLLFFLFFEIWNHHVFFKHKKLTVWDLLTNKFSLGSPTITFLLSFLFYFIFSSLFLKFSLQFSFYVVLFHGACGFSYWKAILKVVNSLLCYSVYYMDWFKKNVMFTTLSQQSVRLLLVVMGSKKVI